MYFYFTLQTNVCFSCLSQTAGLHPTAEQIEMFAFHLPDATLSNLVVSKSSFHFVSAVSDKCYNEL